MICGLPVEFDRRFSLHLYWVSHGLLLLRSGKAHKQDERIDLLFQDVRWMNLPAWLEGLRIEAATLPDIPIPLTPTIQKEAHLMKVYRLISQDISHYVLAGIISVFKDNRNYFENSELLPDYDLRAFGAPLGNKI